MGMRKKRFADVEEMRSVLEKMNKDFGCEKDKPVVGLVCNMKS